MTKKQIDAKEGRPTMYNADMLAKTVEYVERYNEKYGHAIPSIAGLSRVLKVGRNTIYDWAKDSNNSEFSNIIQELMAQQECVLLNSGLIGSFNSTIAKLVLHKHGYSDKAEVTNTVHLESLSDDELQARIDEMNMK